MNLGHFILQQNFKTHSKQMRLKVCENLRTASHDSKFTHLKSCNTKLTTRNQGGIFKLLAK